MSGTTSQPCLGSIVESLRHTERDTGLDPHIIRKINFYWEAVRQQYAAFESDQKGGTSEVFLHEMPGGQFTNLREQARGLGLDSRWHEVALAYHQANELFGDIVKVTPSSKVVGDLALMMVMQDLSPADVLDPNKEIAFPLSVVEMLRGDLGQPPGGWPRNLQAKVVKDGPVITVRPGSLLNDIDLSIERSVAEKRCGRKLDEREFASSLMYPKIFAEFNNAARKYGPVSVLPTPAYFYGMTVGEEIAVALERGKVMVVRLQAISETDDEGEVKLFFEVNGQPRVIRIPNRAAAALRPARRKADEGNGSHIASPMPGSITSIAVSLGQSVKAGDILLTIEAMKMETALHATHDGKVSEVLVVRSQFVEAKDLLVVLSESE
jgi:pyruvate carboxylase